MWDPLYLDTVNSNWQYQQKIGTFIKHQLVQDQEGEFPIFSYILCSPLFQGTVQSLVLERIFYPSCSSEYWHNFHLRHSLPSLSRVFCPTELCIHPQSNIRASAKDKDMLSIPNTPCPVSLQLLFLLRIITCPSLLSQTAHSGLALEGFPGSTGNHSRVTAKCQSSAILVISTWFSYTSFTK